MVLEKQIGQTVRGITELHSAFTHRLTGGSVTWWIRLSFSKRVCQAEQRVGGWCKEKRPDDVIIPVLLLPLCPPPVHGLGAVCLRHPLFAGFFLPDTMDGWQTWLLC